MCSGQGGQQQGGRVQDMRYKGPGQNMGAPAAPGMQSAAGPFMNDAAMSPGDGGGTSYGPTGPSGTTYGGGDGGDAYQPAPQPTRYPPQIPSMQGGDQGQRPPYSADPPPMGGAGDQMPNGMYRPSVMPGNGMGFQSAGGTRMPPIQPPPGGWPMAPTGGSPGYTPPAYNPATDPLAQGSPATPGSGNFGGGLLGGAGAPRPPMATTAPGPGQSGGEGAHFGSQLKRGISNMMRGDRTPYALANPQQRAAIEARQQAATRAIAADPSLARNPGSPFTPGPNQYIDDKGQLQYGYGQNDPRNGGAPLYDDPVNGIKGTLGRAPSFNYNAQAYRGNRDGSFTPSAPSQFAQGVSTLSPAELAQYTNPWIGGGPR